MKVYSPSMLLELFKKIPMEERVWSNTLALDFKRRLEEAGYPVLDVQLYGDWLPAAQIRLVEIDPMTNDHWTIFIPVILEGMTRCPECTFLPCGCLPHEKGVK